jgi:transposase
MPYETFVEVPSPLTGRPSPLNPIEMAFAKIKAHRRAAAARTFDALSNALGSICNLFNSQECRNYFTAAGYGLD